jgi:hypothetical protein
MSQVEGHSDLITADQLAEGLRAQLAEAANCLDQLAGQGAGAAVGRLLRFLGTHRAMLGTVLGDDFARLYDAAIAGKEEKMGGEPPLTALTATAPSRIFLLVGADPALAGAPFPADDALVGVTWAPHSVLAAEVEYIRADLQSTGSINER